MSNEFANFINKQTGTVVYLPAHYAELFPNELELTDKDVECVDCNTPEPDVAEPPVETAEVPTEIAITEPARRSRRTNSSE